MRRGSKAYRLAGWSRAVGAYDLPRIRFATESEALNQKALNTEPLK